MSSRGFALVIGFAFLLMGILGFVQTFVYPVPVGYPLMRADSYYGMLLGIFPVNIVLNLIHIIAGALGIASAGAFRSAKAYSRGFAVVIGALAVMGLIPEIDTFFGWMPLFGTNIWLHGIPALAAVIFGFMMRGAYHGPRRRRYRSDGPRAAYY